MKDLCIKADKITLVLDFDRMTGAVLDKFLSYSVNDEVNVTINLKKDWARDLGVTVRTINNKLHHMKKVGVISHEAGNKYVLDGIYYEIAKKRTKWYWFSRK